MNMGSMFGLGRMVTMNALLDVVGGPNPITQGIGYHNMPQSSQNLNGINVTTDLKASLVDDIDELDAILDTNIDVP